MTPIAEKLLNICLAALSADAKGGTLINESHIQETVETFVPMSGKLLSHQDINEVIDEITRRFNVWSGKASTLIGKDPGHQAWLPGKRSEIAWRFWNRYRLHLETKLPHGVLDQLDDSTDRILGLLEDPARTGPWRRQGLVVGHVQSGKTGNYTGLLCKAADAGYKVLVVLSGVHNSLRAQTQIRMDEGFLGYARSFNDNSATKVLVGVGLKDASVLADCATTRDENGDFSRLKARDFLIHAGGNALLFVVKKNVRVLSNLIDWAELSAKKTLDDGRKVIADVPLLVIDDEADQASIDINHQPINEETGQPDPDHDPSSINRLIRQLLETFEKRAYIGYTATPFANVFIHRKARTFELGDDLFPRHFITNLAAPSDYFGPSRVFGSDEDGLPPIGIVPSRIRFVDDASEWVPASHKSTHQPRWNGSKRLPPSLEQAIRAFIIASAARRARGHHTDHKSMLVHVTRFTAVQRHVHAQIDAYVQELRIRWRARKTSPTDTLASELKTLWEDDFSSTSVAHGGLQLTWSVVEPEIWSIFERLQVNLVNAKASDALIYEEYREHGLHVIAVGGDKLSRGLTLEGLTVSYFLRSARMYDTLMQMGRWFGYRQGYDDLCRLYLSPELAEWYGHIADASEELRQEFERMVMLGGTPEDYGLRVRTHPALAISGRLRPGTRLIKASLSATPFEPTVLMEESSGAVANWEETRNFCRQMGVPAEFPVRRPDADMANSRGNWPGAVLWKGIDGRSVLNFLKHFVFADQYLVRTPSSAVTDYIAGRLADGELRNWTVVLMGKQDGNPSKESIGKAVSPLPVQVGGALVYSVYRQRLTAADDKRKGRFYVTKRLGSPRDEQIDLTSEEYEELETVSTSLGNDPARGTGRGALTRSIRPAERGLLILYLLTPALKSPNPEIPLVAPYISFPYTSKAAEVEYAVDDLLWQQEIGGIE